MKFLACLLLLSPAAFAVTTFNETFDTGASGWLNNASPTTTPAYSATGGVGDSGYISYTSTFTSGASGGFGAPPLSILMRANDAANASGDAFVGNWLTPGAVSLLTISVRHNYTSALDLYARLDGGGGAAASLATGFSIAPNTWTLVNIPITNTNSPFLSYGAGGTGEAGFNAVFDSIQNLQFGLYLPASTTFTDLKFDIDNVGITASAVPEPSCALLGAAALGLTFIRRRRA